MGQRVMRCTHACDEANDVDPSCVAQRVAGLHDSGWTTDFKDVVHASSVRLNNHIQIQVKTVTSEGRDGGSADIQSSRLLRPSWVSSCS